MTWVMRARDTERNYLLTHAARLSGELRRMNEQE
jgi:hypothetical protein